MKKIMIGVILAVAVMQPVLGQTIFENNGTEVPKKNGG